MVGHVSNDEFFTQLTTILDKNREKGHGTVYLTQKRLTFDGSSSLPSPSKVLDDPLWDTHPENPLPIIIRAHNNRSAKRKGTERQDAAKDKVSTMVQPDELEAFFIKYADVCKAGMGALKKRDKKKRKDKKKKKRAGDADVKG